MTTAATIIIAASAGAFFWTFMEYVLHRFAFHERRGANYGSREHLRHHAQKDWTFDNQWQAWIGVFIVGLGVMNAVGRFVINPTFGWALGTGFVVGYFAYEFIHAASHLWAPRNRYGAWVRRNHFHHHFAEPMRNHGVTLPLWDHVFGTHTPVETVTVPRRMAMRWLLDENGEVHPELADTWKVRGRGDRPTTDDTDRAFANLAPVVTTEGPSHTEDYTAAA